MDCVLLFAEHEAAAAAEGAERDCRGGERRGGVRPTLWQPIVFNLRPF